MSELNCCYVVNSVGETSVPADIATALTRRTEIDVDILAWFSASDFEGSDIVDVTEIQAPNTSLGIDLRTYRKATRHLQGYDIIQAHHNHSGSFAKVIAKTLGIPVVSREGNTRNGFTRKGRILNGLTNSLADRIVPVSQAVYDSFTFYERLLVDDDDVCVINNGVDFSRIERKRDNGWSLSECSNVGEESILVGNASLLTEQKAIDILISALADANEASEVPLELVIAGDGSRRDGLERQVRNLGLGDSVHFLGLIDRSRVHQLMREIDIYAMPSRWEGFSAAAVEALGIGNACIFSDIAPFTQPFGEVAKFHPVDDSNSLAQLLVEFAECDSLRQDYATKARNYVRTHHSMERVVSDYQEVYDSLIQVK